MVAAGGIEAVAVSGTIEAEDDGLESARATCRMNRSDLWCCFGWDGAGAPGGASSRPEPGAGGAGPGAA